MTDLFRYDFGYDWPWTYGHAIAALVAMVLTVVASTYRRTWLRLLFGALTLWALAGAVVVNGVMRFSRPLELPSPQFLGSGQGRVLDVGAGSGRSALMVLLARPNARVTALDIFSADYGIGDNSPERLQANARTAGVADRLDVQAGDMREMPLDDRSFDAAVSAFSIDHLNRADRQRAYRELQRVLRPGGDFLLLTINNDAWVRGIFPFLAHHGYFGPKTNIDRWRDELAQAGFAVVDVGTQPGTIFVLARTRTDVARARP